MNTFKTIRKNGDVKLITSVLDIEYKKNDNNGITVDIQVIDAGSNVQHDYFIENVELLSGDQSFLMNDMGTTIDVIRVK